MSALDKATPRPWFSEEDEFDPDQTCIYGGPHQDEIASMTWCRPDEVIAADAALIVLAVNSFEALTAERDALKTENDTLQWMRFGLARELLEALSVLRDWDGSEDLERKARMEELRALLEQQP